MKKLFSFITFFAASLLPVVSFAQATTPPPAPQPAFSSLFTSLTSLIGIINNLVIPLIIGIAIVAFMYGLIKYVTSGADETARTEARNTIVTGIIVIVVMVSVYGLVRFVLNTFGLDALNNQGITSIPRVPTLQNQP